MKNIVYFCSVVGSAIIIATGAYVVSSGSELTIADSAQQLTFGWFQPPTHSPEPPVKSNLQLKAEQSPGGETIISLIGTTEGPTDFVPGDLFLDVDGDHVYPLLPGTAPIDDALGFDYVFDFDYASSTYQLYSLSDQPSSLRFTTDPQTGGLQPYQYLAGGTQVASGSFTAGGSGAGGGGTGGGGTGGGGTGEPDTGEPDTGEPDTGEPDTGEPDTGEPDTGEPDTGTATIPFVLPLPPEWPFPELLSLDPPLAGLPGESFNDPQLRQSPDEDLSAVPEPATWMLLLTGLLAGYLMRKRLN